MNFDTSHPPAETSATEPQEILKRRQFCGFRPKDNENLHDLLQLLKSEADAIVAAFYSHLRKFEELQPYLSSKHVVKRLQKIQRQYLLGLGEGLDHPAYWDERKRIGLAHERVGLAQKWYLGAYAVLFELIAQRLTAGASQSSGRLANQLVSLQKVFVLDSLIAVETYYQTVIDRLENALQHLSEAQHALEQSARTDSLTGILNRRFLIESLEKELERSRRFSRSFSLLFIDIDHFKDVNDLHGHALGDLVLKKLTQWIGASLRPADIFGRYGGEELLVGLVETNKDAAHRIAERLRHKIALSRIENHGQTVSFTISIGLAELGPEIDRLETLIERADQALYRAKAEGRNRVCDF